VNPVTDPGVQARQVYLPPSAWYDFWTGERVRGGKFMTAAAPLQIIPLYARAGSVLPMGPAIEYAQEKPPTPIELRIYPGADGDFTLYEDDGLTYNYEKGAYATIPMRWDDARQTLTLGDRQGSFPGMLACRTFRVVWVGRGHGNDVAPSRRADRIVEYIGRALTVARRAGKG
jgi:alpha-D-xyloside xylohydrolase